jgi:hypothetical protein
VRTRRSGGTGESDRRGEREHGKGKREQQFKAIWVGQGSSVLERRTRPQSKAGKEKEFRGVAYHISQNGRNNCTQAGQRGREGQHVLSRLRPQINQAGAFACTRPHSAHTAGLVRCLLWCLWPDSAAPLWKVRWQSWQCHWGGGSTCRRKQKGRGGRGGDCQPGRLINN